MKHITYDKITCKIVAEIRCNESTASLQKTDTIGVLIDVPCPSNPEQYKVINNQLIKVS